VIGPKDKCAPQELQFVESVLKWSQDREMVCGKSNKYVIAFGSKNKLFC